jgi:hypothetical protein
VRSNLVKNGKLSVSVISLLHIMYTLREVLSEPMSPQQEPIDVLIEHRRKRQSIYSAVANASQIK